MSDRRDLELVLESGTPVIVIETTDETRVLELLREIAVSRSASSYRPLFRWSITDGIQRLDLELEAQRHNADPEEALRHIRATGKPGVFALLDFHPFLKEPVHIRLLKDIATNRPLGDTTTLADAGVVDVIQSAAKSGKDDD